jgi:hypothetical protein
MVSVLASNAVDLGFKPRGLECGISWVQATWSRMRYILGSSHVVSNAVYLGFKSHGLVKTYDYTLLFAASPLRRQN